MRVLIVTPLYPPEVADAAVYAKELAKRLAKRHEVTVVAYTRLPEQIPGVTVITIDKRQPRLSRLYAFRKAFENAIRDADIAFAVNGASVELPIALASRPKSVPLVFCLADTAAHARAGIIERLAFGRARAIVRDLPLPRPEILPLEPIPETALAAYEASWETHLKALDSLFPHV